MQLDAAECSRSEMLEKSECLVYVAFLMCAFIVYCDVSIHGRMDVRIPDGRAEIGRTDGRRDRQTEKINKL
jgi:hypothetical protein